ncbi:MAG: hypothetical protein AB8I08_32445 [Sandaracinaceae bacterium]
MDDFDFQDGASSPAGSGGVNVHDPVFASDPWLRRLRRHFIPSIVAFLAGLLLGVGVVVVGLDQARFPLVVAGALLALAGVGYFGFVSVAMNVGARRANRHEAAAIQARLRTARRD